MFILAIDIETSGSSFIGNGILSIGASLQNISREELESFLVNISLADGRKFEQSCKENFWDKNPKTLEFVSQSPLHPTEAMNKFGEFVDRIKQQYQGITVVSDNPSFDIAWIDHYFTAYTDRKPLRYLINDGQYAMIWDSSSIQKTWCYIKTPGAEFLNLPRDHKKILQLEFVAPKDHNPLNDARNIAGFYIQTIQQMSEFKKSLPQFHPQRFIKLEEHNPEWKGFFESEKLAIKKAFHERDAELIDLYHVGSTSVEGLIAKPIIDMILVVRDPYIIDQPLVDAGYKYKGEYNLPMRRMFGKKDSYEVYMHVYEEGNPEIDLNLAFKAFLTNNPQAREEYSALKTLIISKDATHKTTSTGITTYNLEKNEFIKSVLTSIGFDGLCMRLCSQQGEWSDYRLIRDTYIAKTGRLNDIDNLPDKKHIILVKGVENVAAAQVNISVPNAFIEFIGVKKLDETSPSILEYFLGNIEKWLSKLGVLFVTTFVHQEDSSLFEHYSKLGEVDDVLHLMKYLETGITGEQMHYD